VREDAGVAAATEEEIADGPRSGEAGQSRPAFRGTALGLATPRPLPGAVPGRTRRGDMAGPEISMGFRPGKVYTGRLMSLDFKDADIQNILRLIAEVSGLNVVAGDDVKGTVTVRLVNVPWDQALDIVLASRALGYVRSGNILRVAPAERLKAEEAAMLADRRSEKLEILVVEAQPVNYAKASDVQPQIESLLSDRDR
jgi:type IV pilus assembly protein PilQ